MQTNEQLLSVTQTQPTQPKRVSVRTSVRAGEMGIPSKKQKNPG